MLAELVNRRGNILCLWVLEFFFIAGWANGLIFNFWGVFDFFWTWRNLINLSHSFSNRKLPCLSLKCSLTTHDWLFVDLQHFGDSFDMYSSLLFEDLLLLNCMFNFLAYLLDTNRRYSSLFWLVRKLIFLRKYHIFLLLLDEFLFFLLLLFSP